MEIELGIVFSPALPVRPCSLNIRYFYQKTLGRLAKHGLDEGGKGTPYVESPFFSFPIGASLCKSKKI